MNDVTPGDPGPGPERDGAYGTYEGGTHDGGGRPAEAAADGGVPAVAPYEPAAPAPLGVVRAPTGNTEVDTVLERLADADHLPADGHLEVYEDVHRGLRDVLGALDTPDRTAHHPAQPVPHDHRS
ncbi:hypothetical protein [Streptomyces sp. NPDC058953]|uniref:hypothetical protein n=1 Tax=unclassified Streptomyces TaxID=2593676 RepID=UPI0036C6128E